MFLAPEVSFSSSKAEYVLYIHPLITFVLVVLQETWLHLVDYLSKV